MKKSLLTRLGAGALILTLVSTVLLSGTLAKYTSSKEGDATAVIAAWSFKANAGNETGLNIDLGDYRKALINTGSVADGVIAPGTSGEFKIAIDGTGSDVSMGYTLTIAAATGATQPTGLTFTANADGTDKAYIPGTPFEGTIAQGSNMKKEIIIKYAWAVGEENPVETTAAEVVEDNGRTLTYHITTKAVQLDPTTTPAI